MCTEKNVGICFMFYVFFFFILFFLNVHILQELQSCLKQKVHPNNVIIHHACVCVSDREMSNCLIKSCHEVIPCIHPLHVKPCTYTYLSPYQHWSHSVLGLAVQHAHHHNHNHSCSQNTCLLPTPHCQHIPDLHPTSFNFSLPTCTCSTAAILITTVHPLPTI